MNDGRRGGAGGDSCLVPPSEGGARARSGTRARIENMSFACDRVFHKYSAVFVQLFLLLLFCCELRACVSRCSIYRSSGSL